MLFNELKIYNSLNNNYRIISFFNYNPLINFY